MVENVTKLTMSQRLAQEREKQQQATGAVVSLGQKTEIAKLRVFVSSYAGLNYTFASSKVVVFKQVAGKSTYYATEEEATELRTKRLPYIKEVSEAEGDTLAFKQTATDLHKANLLITK
jgi:hypothetical protein